MVDNANQLTYKGYITKIHFDKDDKILYGKLLNTSAFVNFESESAAEIEEEFHKAVDDYLIFCKEVEKTPVVKGGDCMHIKIVRCDDWCWLYINGETSQTEGEGHEIEHEVLIYHINDFISDNHPYALHKIDLKTLWVSDEWVDDNGCELPTYFIDIPLEAFVD